MSDDEKARVFKLLENADNFVKYAPAGKEDRAASRAARKLDKASALAARLDDAQLNEMIRLRRLDLKRRATSGPGAQVVDEREPVVTSPLPEHAERRLPPHQTLKRGWPVLHEGPIPIFDPRRWSFRVFGACDEIVELDYDGLKALPNIEMLADFHCVTGWSRLDNLWRGVRPRTLLEMARPHHDTTHVMVTAEYGYNANLPLEVLYADDVLLAWSHDGADLQPRHGFPLRLVVPRLYAWKSVKWVRSFELLTGDRRGFWEVRGYHNEADPWREERYSYQETKEAR